MVNCLRFRLGHVVFEVSLLKEGEVYAWAEAKPFEMGVETQISPQLQPSRVGAFTQPHAPGFSRYLRWL